MTKEIDFSKDVNTLCKEYPELIDILVGLGFKPIANPIIRKTVGSRMTVPMGAEAMNIPMEKILFALAKEDFSITGDKETEEKTSSRSHEPGHVFLARMGKTRLRPGGKDATEWLLDKAGIEPDTKVLEVACNMGTTLTGVVEKYGCHATGLDLDQEALDHAADNVREHNLTDKITLVQGSAFELPFPNNSFDIIINEAMLTMLVGDQKDKALSEYSRVLKPGGRLLTQDVCLRTEDLQKQNEITQGISRAINVHVEPLTMSGWNEKFESHNFTTDYITGSMTLLDPEGMIHDEGEQETLEILMHAMKTENADFFERMFNFFNNNKDDLGYIALVSTKTI